jgi:hypothetical protein
MSEEYAAYHGGGVTLKVQAAFPEIWCVSVKHKAFQ